MHRREFLKLAGIAAASTAMVQAKEPDIQFPSDARRRLAVASYPFRDFLETRRTRKAPGHAVMPLTAFPALVVKRFQLHNIEPLDEHFASTEPTYLKELREAVEKAGSQIVNIPCNPKGSLCDPDEARREASVDNARHWVDVAVAVGSPSIRVHIEAPAGQKPKLDLTVKSLRAVAAYGGERNVVVNLENDDPRSEEAAFLVQAIEGVASPYLRALPDFCNSMLLGPEKYNYDSVQAMFAHAYCISHVKDSEEDNGKVYRVDVAHTFQIAKASGYRGFFSMEWEGGGDPYAGTQKLIDASLRSLA